MKTTENNIKELLVIDLEATCWDGPTPSGQESEIIEIGLCRVDLKAGESREIRSILVRPERSEVSAFCTELTTLTPEMVAGGVSFAEACAEVNQHRIPGGVWASFGDYDRKQFVRQCESFGVPYPFGSRHINLKRVFAETRSSGRPVGMARALRMLDLPLVGTHHRGSDDAANIAQIAIALYRAGCLPYFPLPKHGASLRGGTQTVR